MSAGFWFSTSRCHSTSCHRSGREANALAAAPPSKPATAVSVNGTPGSNGVRSSVVVRLLVAAHLVDVQPAYGGQQVGAEGDVGAATAEQHVEHLDEGLGDQIVGVGTTHEHPREPGGGIDVAGEERAVGGDVPFTHPGDQLRVRQLDGSRRRWRSWRAAALCGRAGWEGCGVYSGFRVMEPVLPRYFREATTWGVASTREMRSGHGHLCDVDSQGRAGRGGGRTPTGRGRVARVARTLRGRRRASRCRT